MQRQETNGSFGEVALRHIVDAERPVRAIRNLFASGGSALLTLCDKTVHVYHPNALRSTTHGVACTVIGFSGLPILRAWQIELDRGPYIPLAVNVDMAVGLPKGDDIFAIHFAIQKALPNNIKTIFINTLIADLWRSSGHLLRHPPQSPFQCAVFAIFPTRFPPVTVSHSQ
jgi:hypothetical protein